MKQILLDALFLSLALLIASFLTVEKNKLEVDNFPLPATAVQKVKEVGAPPSNAGVCDLSAIGLDCGVTGYLEKNLAWLTKGGKDFCSYESFGDDGNRLFVYFLCGEYYQSGGKIYEASGSAGPAILTRSDAGLALWVPRDGSYFTADIKDNFPQALQAKIIDYDLDRYERLHKINIRRAETHFGETIDFKVVKPLEPDCQADTDCKTPSEYLILSSCQFTTRCVDGKCSVICPNYNFPTEQTR